MEYSEHQQDIVALQALYHEQKEALSAMEEEWVHPINVTKKINITYFVLIFLSAIGGLVYGFYELDTTGKTYEYIIGVVLGVSIGIISCGAITLVLKPIFWMIRKNMLDKLAKIDEAQYELLQIYQLIMQNEPNTKQNRRNLRQEEQLCEHLIYERYLKVEIMRRLGWVWIAAALLFSIVVLMFFLWILAVIILILGVGVALLLPSGNSSYHRHYGDSYEEKSGGVLSSIYNITFGAYFELKKEHEALRMEIDKLQK